MQILVYIGPNGVFQRERCCGRSLPMAKHPVTAYIIYNYLQIARLRNNSSQRYINLGASVDGGAMKAYKESVQCENALCHLY